MALKDYKFPLTTILFAFVNSVWRVPMKSDADASLIPSYYKQHYKPLRKLVEMLEKDIEDGHNPAEFPVDYITFNWGDLCAGRRDKIAKQISMRCLEFVKVANKNGYDFPDFEDPVDNFVPETKPLLSDSAQARLETAAEVNFGSPDEGGEENEEAEENENAGDTNLPISKEEGKLDMSNDAGKVEDDGLGNLALDAAPDPQEAPQAPRRRGPPTAAERQAAEDSADPLSFLPGPQVPGARGAGRARADPAEKMMPSGNKLRVYRKSLGEADSFVGDYLSEEVARYGTSQGGLYLFLQQVVMRRYPPAPGESRVTYRVARVARDGRETPVADCPVLPVEVPFGGHVSPVLSSQPVPPPAIPEKPLQAATAAVAGLMEAQEQLAAIEDQFQQRADERAERIAAAQGSKDDKMLAFLMSERENDRRDLEQHRRDFAALQERLNSERLAQMREERDRTERERQRERERAKNEVQLPPPAPNNDAVLSPLMGLVGTLVTQLSGKNAVQAPPPVAPAMDPLMFFTKMEEVRRAAEEAAEKRAERLISAITKSNEDMRVLALQNELNTLKMQIAQPKAATDLDGMLSFAEKLKPLGVNLFQPQAAAGGDSWVGALRDTMKYGPEFLRSIKETGLFGERRERPERTPPQRQQRPPAERRPPELPNFLDKPGSGLNGEAARRAKEAENAKIRASLPAGLREAIQTTLTARNELQVLQGLRDCVSELNADAEQLEVNNAERERAGQPPVQNVTRAIVNNIKRLFESNDTSHTVEYLHTLFARFGYGDLATLPKIRGIVKIAYDYRDMASMQAQNDQGAEVEEEQEERRPASHAPPVASEGTPPTERAAVSPSPALAPRAPVPEQVQANA